MPPPKTDEVASDAEFGDKQCTSRLETQLDSIAASLPGVICSFRRTADGKSFFPYASEKCIQVYGISPEELRIDASEIFARTHPDDKEAVVRSVENSAASGEIWRAEFRYFHPTKGLIWLEGQSSPIREPNADITWHGYVQDVTERKQSEEKLRISEARYRAFFNSELFGVICWSIDGGITDANDTFLRMIGYGRDDLEAGRIDWRKLTPPEFAALDRIAAENIRGTGATSPFEKEYVRKDGSRVPVLLAAVALDASHREGVGFVLDVSERKKSEAHLARLNAERLKAIQSMAAGLAHEINQPLAATATYVTSIKRILKLPPEQRTFDVVAAIDKVTAQVKRAGEIIARLRDFMAHGEPNKLAIHMHEVIKSVFDASAADAEDTGVHMTLRLEASDDGVLADPAQIRQVLDNLIKNAREAMATSARRELVISTRSTETHIRTDVSDTGAGLAEPVRLTAFQPFTTTKIEGMGVGLSISQAIIAAHDGELSAAPHRGGGTIFSIALPLASTFSTDEDHPF